jgi:hypothetical protein
MEPQTSPAAARKALVQHLHDRQLSFRWVACARTDRSYRGAEIVRCNVNFGAPHIEVYCVVLHGGRLVTNFQDPKIACGRASEEASA